MSGKAPYFPNNWKRYKAAPAELFDTVSFMEIMQWKIACWEIPADVFCIIRTTHLKTLKVKEYVYKRQHAAEARITSLMGKRNYDQKRSMEAKKVKSDWLVIGRAITQGNIKKNIQNLNKELR